MKSSKLINYILLLIGLAILFFFIFTLDMAEVRGGLEKLNVITISFIIFLTFLTVLIKSYRWQYLVQKTTGKMIGGWFSFFSMLTGIAAGALTPSRAGEVAKPFLCKTHYDIPASKTISSVFCERAFDLLSLILLFFVGFLLIPIDVDAYKTVSIAFFVFFIVIIAFLFIFPKRFHRILVFVIQKLSPEKWKDKLIDISDNVFSGFGILKKKEVLLFMAVSSILSMVIEVIRLSVVFSVFGFSLNFWMIMFAFSASIIFGLLTMIPGGIGTTEISQAGIITGLLPELKNISLLKGAVFIDRIFAYYLLIGVGGIVLVFHKKWKR